MRGKSACGALIQMMYGMFDDSRMRFFSWGGESFLERVRNNKIHLQFMTEYYGVFKKNPKFNTITPEDP